MDAATARDLRKSRSHKEKSNPPNPLKSKSSRTLMPEHRLRRPSTQPDLLAEPSDWVGRTQPDFLADGSGMSPRRLPPKVLVNVTVQGSLGPVQVMASMDWSVKKLVKATVQLYVKEGRRPQLPAIETAAFKLHYSQFSLECLDSQEKMADLGSRNFFLTSAIEWPNKAEKGSASTPAPATPVESPKEAERERTSASSPAPVMPVEWLRFIVFVQ